MRHCQPGACGFDGSRLARDGSGVQLRSNGTYCVSFALISVMNILDDSISVLGLQVDSWSRL